ncbi:unnamed protein product [Discosporangium mesarthrocarpum]
MVEVNQGLPSHAIVHHGIDKLKSMPLERLTARKRLGNAHKCNEFTYCLHEGVEKRDRDQEGWACDTCIQSRLNDTHKKHVGRFLGMKEVDHGSSAALGIRGGWRWRPGDTYHFHDELPEDFDYSYEEEELEGGQEENRGTDRQHEGAGNEQEEAYEGVSGDEEGGDVQEVAGLAAGRKDVGGGYDLSVDPTTVVSAPPSNGDHRGLTRICRALGLHISRGLLKKWLLPATLSALCAAGGTIILARQLLPDHAKEQILLQDKIRSLEEQLLTLERDRRQWVTMAREMKAAKRADERQLREHVRDLEEQLRQGLEGKRALERSLVERIKEETSKALEGAMEAEKDSADLVKRMSENMEGMQGALQQLLEENSSLKLTLQAELEKAASIEKENARLKEIESETLLKLREETRERVEAQVAAEKRSAECESMRNEMEASLAKEKDILRRQMEARLATIRKGLQQRLKGLQAGRKVAQKEARTRPQGGNSEIEGVD